MDGKQNHIKQRRIEKDLWNQCRVQFPAPGSCPEASLLAAYIDHGLSEKENRKIEGHLAQCQTCLDTILLIREIDNVFYEPVAKKDLLAADNLVKARFSPAPRLRQRLSRWFFPFPVNPVLASTLLLLVCLAGFYLGNHTSADRLFVRNTLAAELQFGLAQPLTVSDKIGEEG